MLERVWGVEGSKYIVDAPLGQGHMELADTWYDKFHIRNVSSSMQADILNGAGIWSREPLLIVVGFGAGGHNHKFIAF